MRLERFRVCNFRSVNDSGWVEVAGTTAFVGRNESGKTALLQALASLNGSDAMRQLSRARDFPADRLYSDFSDSLTVVRSSWSLDEAEQASLLELLPESASTQRVEVGRAYAGEPWVRFSGLTDREEVHSQALDLAKQVRAVPAHSGAAPDEAWVHAVNALSAAVEQPCDDPKAWVADVMAALGLIQEPLAAGAMEVDSGGRAALEELAELASLVSNEAQLERAARDWVLRRLPRFLYLDRYPMIEGRQNLAEFAVRQIEGRATAADAQFAMLLRVAGIDPADIEDLLAADPEIRRQTASRGGAVLTRTLRRIWTDRALKVRFNIDGDHFNTIVSDPTSMCDVEVNLDQRSRGFRWFFSFHVMLAAGSQDGSMTESLLLLDEPGVHLHATGQRDLLRHMSEDLANQVLFATQSPYLVPEGTAGLRAVDSEEGVGTYVRNEAALADVMPLPDVDDAARNIADVAIEEVEIEEAEPLAQTGLADVWDGKTSRRLLEDRRATPRDSLYQPVDPALAEVAERLDGPLLLVESITDFWYLQLASDFLAEAGRAALPDGVLITPVGNPQSIPLLLAQLGESPNAVVLTAERPDPLCRYHEKTFWIGSFLDAPAEGRDQVDLEELFDPSSYARFVRYTYREQLGDREIVLGDADLRLSERYGEAFEELDIEWNRSIPARTVMLGAAKRPDLMMDEGSAARFERIFQAIIDRAR